MAGGLHPFIWGFGSLTLEDLVTLVSLLVAAAEKILLIKAAVLSAAEELVVYFHALYPPVKRLLAVMCGGGLGAASRYGISTLSARLWGTRFPWGTLVVNWTGSFLIGLFFSLAERGRFITPDMRLFLMTGYLGGLTTFSTFSLETVNAARKGPPLVPLSNILSNTVGALALTLAGLWLGRLQ